MTKKKQETPAESISPSNAVKRRWPLRVVLATAVVVATVLVLPGIRTAESRTEIVESPNQYSSNVFVHGWPLEYMRTPASRAESPATEVEWLTLDAWPIHGNYQEFRVYNLLVDLVLCSLLVVVVTWLANVWLHRKAKQKGRNWYSFTTLNLLMLTTVIGMCIPCYFWHRDHVESKELEVASENSLRIMGSGGTDPQIEYVYRGPVWLRRLAGSSYLSFCYHRTSVQLGAVLLAEFSEENSQAIQKYRRAESVSCSYCLSARFQETELQQALTALRSLPKLKKLQIEKAGGFGVVGARPKKYPSVSGMKRYPVLDPVVIVELEKFSELESLELSLVDISAADLASLSKLSNLKHLEFSGAGIFIEDLEPLEHLDKLKTVKLAITATCEELDDFQTKHSRLILLDRPILPFQPVDSDVIMARFERATNGQLSPAASREGFTIDNALLQRQHLTFLEDEILSRYISQITSLELGEVDSRETALELIKSCQSLSNLTVPQVTFSIEDFETMPRNIETLRIRQGKLTVADCQKLISKIPQGDLTITESLFTVADAKLIQNTAPECYLTILGPIPPGGEYWDMPVIYE